MKLPIQPLFPRLPLTMSSPIPRWSADEEDLLVVLRCQYPQHTWEELATLFNLYVPVEKWRSSDALKKKATKIKGRLHVSVLSPPRLPLSCFLPTFKLNFLVFSRPVFRQTKESDLSEHGPAPGQNNAHADPRRPTSILGVSRTCVSMR